jgi:hypothetical protein
VGRFREIGLIRRELGLPDRCTRAQEALTPCARDRERLVTNEGELSSTWECHEHGIRFDVHRIRL